MYRFSIYFITIFLSTLHICTAESGNAVHICFEGIKKTDDLFICCRMYENPAPMLSLRYKYYIRKHMHNHICMYIRSNGSQLEKICPYTVPAQRRLFACVCSPIPTTICLTYAHTYEHYSSARFASMTFNNNKMHTTIEFIQSSEWFGAMWTCVFYRNSIRCIFK